MQSLNPKNPQKTKSYGKELLIVEDLIFRRMNQATMWEYYDQWISDEEDANSDDCDGMSSAMLPPLVNLKQLADAWQGNNVRMANLKWVNQTADPTPMQLKAAKGKSEKVFEILTRESIHREQVFSGYHQLDNKSPNRVENFDKVLEDKLPP